MDGMHVFADNVTSLVDLLHGKKGGSTMREPLVNNYSILLSISRELDGEMFITKIMTSRSSRYSQIPTETVYTTALKKEDLLDLLTAINNTVDLFKSE